jgi:glycosyltransferase involved in cell wall biosynthesis
VRIVQILHSQGYGGAENHALVLSRALHQSGHEVSLACPEGSWLERNASQVGLTVLPLRMRGLYDLVSHWRLRRWVRAERPDIVHGHLIRGAYYAGWAAQAWASAAPVCTAHATTAYKHMGRCRRIIAVSQAVKNQMLARGHADALIDVVHNGMPDVPPAERQARRAELLIPPSHLALVLVGRFVRDKGQDLVLRALGGLPEHVHLYFIGDPQTSFGQEVKALAQTEGLAHRVHFLGYRQDVPRLLCAFDLYVSGSRREALGLSLVEASAAGLPIVATAVGGVPEVVVDQHTGLLVPPDRPDILTQSLAQLIDQPSNRQTLGRQGRQHYLRQFTVEAMLAGTLQTYERARTIPGTRQIP